MKNIIMLILVLASFSSEAAPTCSKNGTRLIYTNGIATSPVEAQFAMKEIKHIIFIEDSIANIKTIDKKTLTYQVTYNYQESFVKDILEAAVQRLPKSYIDSVKAKNAYEAYSYYAQGKLINGISADILNSITESKLSIIKSFSEKYANLPLYNKTINEMLPAYNDAFVKKERVFAISHSQGSLFMNDMYNLLSEGDYKRKFFSGFQIASVLGSPMNSHFDHATNSKDAVVNIVRFLLGALPDNFEEEPLFIKTDGFSDLFINHGILTTYLFDPVLKPQVVEKLIKAGELLESNCNNAAIEITKQENLNLTFDSTDPEDKDVTDLTYEWDFGETPGAPIIVSTESKTISHTYKKAGTYTVNLRVINNDGDTDIKKVDVIVRQAPKAIIAYTKNNLQVNFDSTGNTDLTGLTYAWNFGDGQTLDAKAPSHNYSVAGTYTVSLKVTDAYGASDTASVSVAVQGCTNCDVPQIKITSSTAVEISSGHFTIPFAGQSIRVPISVVDLNNDKNTTVFTITYKEYRFDINTYPFNIFTNTVLQANAASIPVPFAGGYYYVDIAAYNPISKKTAYAHTRFSAVNDSMPSVSTKYECYQSTDSEGNLVNTGSAFLLIGAKDSDSEVIYLGTWHPNQAGDYEGDFTNNAVSSPNGYLYSFRNYEFNERESVFGEHVYGRSEMRVIYKNSDGRVGFVTITNPCAI